jgi:CrcB protein
VDDVGKAPYNRRMIKLLLVGAGGATGAMARYLVGVAYGRLFGPTRGYLATGFINVTGGLLMGLLIGLLALKVSEGGERWRLLLAVGVLGGYTTFSSFALEAVMLMERKDYTAMWGYVLGSVVLSILAVMLGLAISRRVFA